VPRQVDEHQPARAAKGRRDQIPRADASSQPMHHEEEWAGSELFSMQTHVPTTRTTGGGSRRYLLWQVTARLRPVSQTGAPTN
jgi:hypothetical protein